MVHVFKKEPPTQATSLKANTLPAQPARPRAKRTVVAMLVPVILDLMMQPLQNFVVYAIIGTLHIIKDLKLQSNGSYMMREIVKNT